MTYSLKLVCEYKIFQVISRSQLSELIGQLFVKESYAISGLVVADHHQIVTSVLALVDRKAKIVVSGLGKSAIVAKKFVATLNSTGSPAVYLHAADALHGDMGILQADDVLVLISKSGGTAQLLELLDYAHSIDITTVGITNMAASRLAEGVTYPIVLPDVQEIDDGNIVPTSSIVQHLACCDAIAVALQSLQGGTADDFVRLHPRGTLGRLLSLTAADLARTNALPSVTVDADVKSVIYIISTNKLGACCVLDDSQVVGIITDGDIRRMLESYTDLSDVTAAQIMSHQPITIDASASGQQVKEAMTKHNINQMIVTSIDNHYNGMIHIHDLIEE